MEIRRSFDQSTAASIANKIYKIISQTRGLTFRKLAYLKKQLENGSVFVMFEKEKLVGFIIKERLFNSYYEIKSWYVIPKFRKKGIGRLLLKKVTSSRNDKYLMASFYDNPIKIALKEGFRKVTLLQLPFSLTVKFLLSRSSKSIIKHVFHRKSTLLVK